MQQPIIHSVTGKARIKGASKVTIANIGGADALWEHGEVSAPAHTLLTDFVWNSDSTVGFYTFTVDATGSEVQIISVGGTFEPFV